MQLERNNIFLLGLGLGSLLFIAFIGGIFFTKFVIDINSNNITAFSTFVSAMAIVITAYWAKESFWFTKDKLKTEKSLESIEKLSTIEFSKSFIFISTEFKTLVEARIRENRDNVLFTDEDINKINMHLFPILTLLEKIGMLLKFDKINEEIFFEWYCLDFQKLYPNLKKYFIDAHQKFIHPKSWENIEYLWNQFKKTKYYDKTKSQKTH